MKSEEELLAEQQSLAEQTAAVNRQLAAKSLERVEAFAALIASKIKSAAVEEIKTAAAALTGPAAQYAANLLTTLEGTPNLLQIEADRLKAASAEPVAPADPTPVAITTPQPGDA